MNPQFKRALVGISAVALVAAATGQGSAAVLSNSGDPVTPQQKSVLQSGVQLAPKSSKPPRAVVNGKEVGMPNPYLANSPDATATDWSYWRSLMDAQGKQRAKSPALAAAKNKAAGKALPSPLLYDELEPDALGGTNDSFLAAEPVNGFGTGAKQNPRLRILGTMPNLAPTAVSIPAGTEDNGAIPIATSTGIGAGRGAVVTSATLGDGPHGSAGDGTNDFDFYKLTATSTGLTLKVSTEGSPTDTVVAVYNAAGEQLAVDDDSGNGLTSLLSFDLPAAGDYFVLVSGFSLDGPFPTDPNDSGSGLGGADEGAYQVAISAAIVDKDFYGVKLKKGDVLGGSVTGSAGRLVVHRIDGSQSIGSQQDASSLYPVTSPLPGGGNAVFGYVAEEAGWYAVSVEDGIGNYDATVEAYRPGTEVDTKQQTIFLDFDGARVNTSIFGDTSLGVRNLSPFSAFIARWGLPRSAEAELITKITATVTENLKQDLIAQGLNPNVQVKVLNSRGSADQFGQQNVSRIVVGGTIAESGINTIGIAQTIDPGNFGHEETALVLLDVLSNPANGFGDPSINSYLPAGATAAQKIKFISQVVGNVTSHEAGHFVGSYHVDQFNATYNLMDQGGNFPLLYGVGADGLGGTADDVDVDFGEDVYNPNEGFTGIEDTLNNTAWALSKPKG
ncbi:PPC domain-containing protein [Kribbella endophytica]